MIMKTQNVMKELKANVLRTVNGGVCSYCGMSKLHWENKLL